MKTFKNHNSEGLKFKECRKTATGNAVQINEPFQVETLEGTMEGKAGDYLMKGVKDELYICEEAIFNSSYKFI